MCLDGVHDYTHRAEAIAEPAYFVGWNGTHEEFAAAVEDSEVRWDAQTLRELVWALPADCTEEERSRITREYAESLHERYGVAVHVARHRPRIDKEDFGEFNASEKNHHVHLSMTLRAVEGGSKLVGNKLRSMNAKTWLFGEEARMLDLVNSVAATPARKGPADPSIGAQPHLGRAWHMERRGVRTAAGDRWRAHRAAVAEHAAERAELAEIEAEIEANRAALVAAEREEALAEVPPAAPERLGIRDLIRKGLGLPTKAEAEAQKQAEADRRRSEYEQRRDQIAALGQGIAKAKQTFAEARQRAAEEAQRIAEAEEQAEAQRAEKARAAMDKRIAEKPMAPPLKTPAEIRAAIKRDLDHDKGPEPGQSTGGRRR